MLKQRCLHLEYFKTLWKPLLSCITPGKGTNDPFHDPQPHSPFCLSWKISSELRFARELNEEWNVYMGKGTSVLTVKFFILFWKSREEYDQGSDCWSSLLRSFMAARRGVIKGPAEKKSAISPTRKGLGPITQRSWAPSPFSAYKKSCYF